MTTSNSSPSSLTTWPVDLVDPGRIEILVLAIHAVDAQQPARADLLGDARSEFVGARRRQPVRDPGVDPGHVGPDVGAAGAAVGVEPGEQRRQRIFGPDQRRRVGIDVDRRPEILELVGRRRPGVRFRVADVVDQGRHVGRVAGVHHPVAIAFGIEGEPEPRADLRVADVLRPRRIGAVVEVVAEPEIERQLRADPPDVIEEQRVRPEVRALRGVLDRVPLNQGAAADVVPHRIDDAVADRCSTCRGRGNHCRSDGCPTASLSLKPS